MAGVPKAAPNSKSEDTKGKKDMENDIPTGEDDVTEKDKHDDVTEKEEEDTNNQKHKDESTDKKRHDPFATGSEMKTDDTSNFDEIHAMLVGDDLIQDDKPQDKSPDEGDDTTPTNSEGKTSNEKINGIIINTDDSGKNMKHAEGLLNILPQNDQSIDVDKSCQTCAMKLEMIHKNIKLSRLILQPCKICGNAETDLVRKNIEKQPDPSLVDLGSVETRENRKQLLNKQLREAFDESNPRKINMVLNNVKWDNSFGEDAMTMYETTLQNTLFDALLRKKREIAKSIIARSDARVFKAKIDLALELNEMKVVTESNGTDTGDTNGKTDAIEEDPKLKNDPFKGQTALHLAVSQSDKDMVTQMLDRINEEDSIALIDRQATGRFFSDSKKVKEGQYCLFLAAWIGCIDIFRLLVMRGASLNIQDTDGNTILHKLVQLSMKKTESDSSVNQIRWVETSKTMCELVLNWTQVWWKRFVGQKRCDTDSRDATTYLLSIENKSGFTPMTLAAYTGASAMFKMMIHSPAFKTKHFTYGPITDASFRMNEIDSTLCRNDGSSCLESIMYNPVDKACEFIAMQPISTLVLDKWDHYRKFYWMWLVSYIFYMASFTTYMFISPMQPSSFLDMYKTHLDIFRGFLEVIMVLGVPWYLFWEIQDLNFPRHRRWPDPWQYTQDGLYRIIHILFVASLISWIVVHFASPYHEDIVLPLCLFFGWIYVLIFTCVSDVFGIFPVMLQRMIFYDLLRFLLIFFLIIMSMSTAMYCVFRSSPETTDYSTIWYTAYSLFKMTLGMQDVDNLTDAPHPAIAVFLFVLYAVLGNILLLNVLIAMMNESYSSISEKAPVFRLESLQRVFNTLLIERRLPRRFCTARFYDKESKSSKYKQTAVKRLNADGDMVTDTEYTLTVQTLDYMSTPDTQEEYQSLTKPLQEMKILREPEKRKNFDTSRSLFVSPPRLHTSPSAAHQLQGSPSNLSVTSRIGSNRSGERSRSPLRPVDQTSDKKWRKTQEQKARKRQQEKLAKIYTYNLPRDLFDSHNRPIKPNVVRPETSQTTQSSTNYSQSSRDQNRKQGVSQAQFITHLKDELLV